MLSTKASSFELEQIRGIEIRLLYMLGVVRVI